MIKEKKQKPKDIKNKPKKISWKEHEKWLDEFRSPIVYPSNKPVKRRKTKKQTPPRMRGSD